MNNPSKGKWYKFNDTVVEEFEMTDAALEAERLEPRSTVYMPGPGRGPQPVNDGFAVSIAACCDEELLQIQIREDIVAVGGTKVTNQCIA